MIRTRTGLSTWPQSSLPSKVVVLATLCIVWLLNSYMCAQTYTVLYQFTGPEGSVPYGDLWRDGAGNLYGTTLGADTATGTIYKFDTRGALTVLHYLSLSEGEQPHVGLIADTMGNFYGSTMFGGDLSCTPSGVGCGTVFKVNAKSGKFVVLHKFAGGKQGNGAEGLARDAAGNLYGVTIAGGDRDCPNGSGCGILYKLTPQGKFTVLHAFSGGDPDGGLPYGSPILDPEGNLYGTTSQDFWGGTIYKFDTAGVFSVLYTFQGGQDGFLPLAGLIRDRFGNFYGTTADGGGSTACWLGCGTVFKLDASGTESVLYRFQGGTDGAYPKARLVVDKNGNLYGTTNWGGVMCSIDPYEGCGTVFKLDQNGVETVLYRFQGDDGAQPNGGLVVDQNGNVFGTAPEGGVAGFGVLFEITPN